jgi:hypothetical protein
MLSQVCSLRLPLLALPYCCRTQELMPYGRNMNDAVLLPNAQIIIVNGARVRALSSVAHG